MTRSYKMQRRAESHEQTRARIMQATLELHDEKGVVPTTFAAIADRAGVGQATVHRHFPTLSDLVQACGVHVWQEMRPPVPELASSRFADLNSRRERLVRLIQELDSFYARGAHRLRLAARDRQLVPELDGFLRAVEIGIQAFVREALRVPAEPNPTVQVVMALTSLSVWSELAGLKIAPEALTDLKARLLECAIAATDPSTENPEQRSQVAGFSRHTDEWTSPPSRLPRP